MSKYQSFIFESYEFNHDKKILTLHYSYDGQLHFSEIYTFDFTFVPYDSEGLDRAFQLLFFMAGISYYKMYLAENINIGAGQIDASLSKFLSQTYQKGLGEFFYINDLDPLMAIEFPITTEEKLNTLSMGAEGLLVGIGGGKDSLLSVEILRNEPKISTWSLNHREQLEPLIKRTGLPHYYVDRQLDIQLINQENSDAYNGHVPISAIIACVGLVVSILTGYSDHIVSNESSASEPNLFYRDVPINHQYSKSIEFESAFQDQLGRLYSSGPWYCSLLRPLTELHIAKLFSTKGFSKYADVFSSCNRAFTHRSNRMFWDGTCPKCAFVFLALTPFVKRTELEQLFDGKNLLLDDALVPTYLGLLGIEGNKPLECVGEIKESRAAMELAKKIYPELERYKYDLPKEYDYLALSEHKMSSHLFELLQSSVRHV